MRRSYGLKILLRVSVFPKSKLKQPGFVQNAPWLNICKYSGPDLICFNQGLITKTCCHKAPQKVQHCLTLPNIPRCTSMSRNTYVRICDSNSIKILFGVEMLLEKKNHYGHTSPMLPRNTFKGGNNLLLGNKLSLVLFFTRKCQKVSFMSSV